MYKIKLKALIFTAVLCFSVEARAQFDLSDHVTNHAWKSVAGALMFAVGDHVWKAVPAASVLAVNSFWQACAEVWVVPFISNYIDPKDTIQMTIVRDITMVPAVLSNVKEARPFRTDYKHDSSHYVAHAVKVVCKSVGPHILNQAAGVELKPAVRVMLYIADTSSRFWTSLGVSRQIKDPNNAQLSTVEMLASPDYYSVQNIGNALYEGLPASLVVVLMNDNVLNYFQLQQKIEGAVDFALDRLPGDSSKTVYQQDNWADTSGATVKLFAKSFTTKYAFGLICSTAALAIMNAVGKIPAGPTKTIGVPVAIGLLLEANHGIVTGMNQFLQSLPQKLFPGSGEDD